MTSANWKDNLDKTIESARIDARSTNTAHFFTLPRLVELSSAPSIAKMLDIIEKKIDSGDIGVFYRVISPDTKAVIGEFEKLAEVPENIYDETAGYEIDIDPLSDIEVVFRVPPR